LQQLLRCSRTAEPLIQDERRELDLFPCPQKRDQLSTQSAFAGETTDEC